MLSVCISSDNTSVIHDVSMTALFFISASDSEEFFTPFFLTRSLRDQIKSINKLHLVKSSHSMYKGKEEKLLKK